MMMMMMMMMMIIKEGAQISMVIFSEAFKRNGNHKPGTVYRK